VRLRNFCVQMGFALFVAVILAVFVHNVPLAVLYVIGHLIWAFFSDRQTVYGEKHKKSLAEKYPAYSMPDTQYNVGDQTIILRDSFVKAALVDTIYFTDYSSKKKQDKKFLENFYSAAMAGEYTLEQYTVTKTELVPGNDSSDDYYVYSDGRRFEINNSAFKKCSIGDCVVGVTVRGMPIHSVLILINAEHEQPLVAWQNHFYQLKYRMPKC